MLDRLFNSITLSANSVDYLTLKHSANGLSLVYDNATNGMINELRLDGNFNNDLNVVIPVVSDLLNFDFSDPIALLGSQEFLETSADLESLATLSGLSIIQKGVEDPYLQLTATDTTLNVTYKDWDIVGAIEVSETWQPDPDAFLTALQNLVTNSNDLDLSELSSLYQGAGSLSLSIIHDDAGKLAEGIIHDFGDLVGSLDREAGDEFIFGTAVGDSYAIDSNGLAAVVFKEREFDEAKTVELLETLGLKEKQLEGTVISSSGAIEGVTVFVDRNNNYSIDLDEEVAVTDASGNYLLYLDNADIEGDTVVALPLNVGSYTSQLSPLTLEAPINSSIISPLTTLSERSEKTIEEIFEHLNIQSDIDVLTFNAFADGVDSVSATEVIDGLKTIETATGIALATSQAMGLPFIPDYTMIENIVFSDSIIG